jgi:hemerythrin superfamily protein
MAKQDEDSKTATENTGQNGAGGSGASASKTDAAAMPNASAPKPQATEQAAQATPESDAIALLKADHRKVDALFKQYESAADNRKTQLIQQICRELVVHTTIEEEIFYPACRRAASDEDPLDEAQVEHDSAKLLIADLMEGDGQDRFRDAKVSVLAEQIRHHVKEEEEPSKGIFARAQQAGVNTSDLAQRVVARKQALERETGSLEPSRPVSIQPTAIFQGQQQEDFMARQDNNGRDRDDRGRFMSDDDRGGRSRYDRDDDRSYRSRSRDDDDDGRGRGWSGDPEGHAEAARRGWAERRGESRSFSRDDDDDYRRGGGRSGSSDRDRDERGRFTSDDDDRGYRSRSGYDDDDRRGGRGGSFDRDRDERGRFASDDDGRYRSRGRDDDDDRGRSPGRDRGGWFGDSEGHAAAARRGWDERGDGGGRSMRSRDDDDRSRSRSRSSRDDDDDRRGRGQGGWFGDSRGHAEAARRGWEDRR